MDGLAELLINGVACKADKYESHNKWIATCQLPDGRDLGAEIVRLGFACAATAYSKIYVDMETEARTNQRGLWAAGLGYDLAALCIPKAKNIRIVPARGIPGDTVP